MSINTVIMETLNKLEKENFRNGFEYSLLNVVCDNIRKINPVLGDRFWNLYLTGSQSKLIAEFFDGDKEKFDYFEKVSKMAAGPGSFEMPSWGTYGT